MNLSIDVHPLLDSVLLHTIWPKPLGEIDTLADLDKWFSVGTESPLPPQDDVKLKVRNLLRHGGFKPSGRSKPASEYLIGAVEKGRMSSINPAVDCCNVASLYSGLPISVVDIGRGHGPWQLVSRKSVRNTFSIPQDKSSILAGWWFCSTTMGPVVVRSRIPKNQNPPRHGRDLVHCLGNA